MNKLISIICILGIVTVPVFGQPSLVKNNEGVKTNSNEPALSFKKYEFDNGLVVLVNEDHSDPVVTVDFNFRVGSANDYADRTGTVYMIRKMLFATHPYQDQQYNLSWLKNYGAYYKTQLDRDHCRLLVNAPAGLLETILWQQLHNMSDFTRRVDQNTLDLAKEELTGEMIDSFGNNPYGMGALTINQALYDFAYPYSWSVFGTGKQLPSIYPEDLKKFYEEWFGVNNLILTISGDVDPGKVLNIINNGFAKLPSGTKTFNDFQNQVDMLSLTSQERFSNDRYITVKLQSTNPTLVLKYNTVPRYNEAQLYLDLYARYLNKEGSFLYETLVAGQLAKSIKVTHETFKQGGEFTIEVVAEDSVSLATINDTISYLLKAKLLPDELTPEQMNKRPERIIKEKVPYQDKMDKLFNYVLQYNSSLIQGLEESCKKAVMLSDYEFYADDPGFFGTELQKSYTVNLMILPKIVSEFLVRMPKLVCSVVTPDQTGLIAGKQNFEFHSLQSIITHATEEDLKVVKSQNSHAPKIKKPDIPAMPVYTQKTLENGFTLLTHADKESDMVNVKFMVTLDQGSAQFNQMAAGMVANIIDAQISQYREGELESSLTMTGGSYKTYSDGNVAVLEINVLKQNSTSLREFFRTLLMESRFMGYNPDGVIITEVDKYKNANSVDLQRFLSSGIFSGEVKKPRKKSPDMTPGFLLKERIARILENAQHLVTPKNSTLVFTGNFDGSMESELTETFMTWTTEQQPKEERGESVQKTKKEEKQESIYVFDNGSVKAGIYFNYLVVDAKSSADVNAARMLKFILSSTGNTHPGGFDLFETVEKKDGDKYYYFIKTKMNADSNLGFAYQHLKKQLDFYRDKKIKCKDFRAYKKQFLFQNIAGYESYSAKNDLIFKDYDGIAVNYRGKNYKLAKKTKRSALRGLLKNSPESNYTTVITGKSTLVLKNIPENLQGKAVVIDQNGNKVEE